MSTIPGLGRTLQEPNAYANLYLIARENLALRPRGALTSIGTTMETTTQEARMHWTLIIKSHPDADGNPVLQALRMAASALADEIGISIFLTQDALSLALPSAEQSSPRRIIQRDLLAEIRELGGDIRAVGLEWLPGTSARQLLEGVVSAGMKELVRVSKMSDQVITY